MTIFGNDSSNHNQALVSRDGLDFYTHKVSDGDHFYADPYYQPHMVKAHQLGIPVMGSYHVLHGQRSIDSQADWWVQLVRAQTPWWRDKAAWIWQCDAEPFGYNITPSITEINALGDAVCRRANIPASSYVAYAPEWVYGAALKYLRYPIWQSSYGSNPTGNYRIAYPGDNSNRWNLWSTGLSKSPMFLQYGSKVTAGGVSTMDINAFRGTLDQLIAALGGKRTTRGENMPIIGHVVNDKTQWFSDGLYRRALTGPDAWPGMVHSGLDAEMREFSSLAELEAVMGPVAPAPLDAAAVYAMAADVSALKSAVASLATLVQGMSAVALTSEQMAALTAVVQQSNAPVLSKLDALHNQLASEAQAGANALAAGI